MKNNADAEVIIDATGPHPHVIDIMSPGNGPEGFAISPNGKLAITPLLLGSGAKDSDWFKTKGGQLVVMSIGAGGKLTVTGKAPLGACRKASHTARTAIMFTSETTLTRICRCSGWSTASRSRLART